MGRLRDGLRRVLDRRTGTKYPDSGVTPRPTMEVRAALLALNGQDAPYRVRNALPKEKSDLVAECAIPQLGVTLKTRMRLIPEKREVRALEERPLVEGICNQQCQNVCKLTRLFAECVFCARCND